MLSNGQNESVLGTLQMAPGWQYHGWFFRPAHPIEDEIESRDCVAAIFHRTVEMELAGTEHTS